MNYEELLIEADHVGLIVKEKPLRANTGRIRGNRVAIRNNLTTVEKSCVLAEELGHHYTSAGNILDQGDEGNRKQELRARLWAYNQKIGMTGLISAYEYGCRNCYEIAEYLDVTEEFLQESIDCYRKKYGISTQVDNYVIFFEPSLIVMKRLELLGND